MIFKDHTTKKTNVRSQKKTDKNIAIRSLSRKANNYIKFIRIGWKF